MKKIALFLAIIFTSIFANGQLKAVSGKVTAFHKYPFKNIKVKAKKSKSEVLTDENGVFTIVCYPNDILIFESKSCITTKYKITNSDDSVKINLVFRVNEKSKEYAVGYGIISKEDLIYAISNLNNSEVDFSTYKSVYDLLRGRFPGVVVKIDNEIVIRGSTSFLGSSNALLVVDGIIVSDLTYLYPGDIVSIDILKDAGSTAMYGVNGANGVVVIKTKKGD
jgi:TonB-dependent SusC/RagA subfamily outer membrane receptor